MTVTDTTEPKDLPRTFEDVFDGLAFEALSIMYQRQRKYGPENIRQQGLWGVWQRIRADKMARIDKSFNGRIEGGQIILDAIRDDFGDETWEDTLFDIANLSLIMIAVKRGVWGLPLREDTNEIEVLAAAHPEGVPQLTLTPEEEEAERARQALAGEDDEGTFAGTLASQEDLAELQQYLGSDGDPTGSIDDATPEEWDRAAAAQMAHERLERDRLARGLGGQD